LPVFFRAEPGEALEVFAENGLVCEVEFVGYLLNA
jgi:hypothetical protein